MNEKTQCHVDVNSPQLNILNQIIKYDEGRKNFF